MVPLCWSSEGIMWFNSNFWFYPFILELCSVSLATYYSENYAGILASALAVTM